MRWTWQRGRRTRLRRCEMGNLEVMVTVTDVSVDTDAILKKIYADPNYSKFRIVVDSPHADFIEFGTDGKPGWGKNPERRGKGHGRFLKDPPESYVNIRKWLIARSGIPEKEADAIAYRIYRKIMQEGIPPQPFVRPAMFNMKQRLSEGGDLHNKKVTMKELALMLLENIRDILEENKTSYGDRALLRSIYIESVSADEENGFEGVSDVPQEIWENPYADMHGNTERALERQRNINRLKW